MKKHKQRQHLPAMLSALAIAMAGCGTAGSALAVGVTDEDILKDAETTHRSSPTAWAPRGSATARSPR